MIFLLDLPEPIHGLSNVNLAMVKYFIQSNCSPKVINTAPSRFSRFFNTRFWVIFKISHSFYSLFKFFLLSLSNSRGVVYRPINGGYGQLYDIAYIIIARIFANRLFIHHHSFNYINRPSSLFKFVNKLAGKCTTHIVLGGKMKYGLCSIYNIDPESVRVLSNLSFSISSETNNPEEPNGHKDKLVLGYLANLCLEKGIDTFVSICEILNARGVPYQAIIAGPFSDDSSKILVEDICKKNSNVTYVGPVYGRDKYMFYQQLDCFVFPSRYENEAEPLVLYEAGEFGAHLVGTRRGCMEGVISDLGGDSFDESDGLSVAIAERIQFLYESKFFCGDFKLNKIKMLENQKMMAKKSLTLLLTEFKSI